MKDFIALVIILAFSILCIKLIIRLAELKWAEKFQSALFRSSDGNAYFTGEIKFSGFTKVSAIGVTCTHDEEDNFGTLYLPRGVAYQMMSKVAQENQLENKITDNLIEILVAHNLHQCNRDVVISRYGPSVNPKFSVYSRVKVIDGTNSAVISDKDAINLGLDVDGDMIDVTLVNKMQHKVTKPRTIGAALNALNIWE